MHDVWLLFMSLEIYLKKLTYRANIFIYKYIYIYIYIYITQIEANSTHNYSSIINLFRRVFPCFLIWDTYFLRVKPANIVLRIYIYIYI